MNNQEKIIVFPSMCTLCESKDRVQYFAGLRLCLKCLKNVQISNPNLFAANDEVEHRDQD